MTFRLFIVLVLCPIGLLWSGEKKLDLETAVSHYRTLQPATLKQVQWLKAGSRGLKAESKMRSGDSTMNRSGAIP